MGTKNNVLQPSRLTYKLINLIHNNLSTKKIFIMNKNFLICLLMWVMCLPAFAQETLTLFDGTTEGTGTSTALTTNEYVPAAIGNWNKPARSQFVIPASYLEGMKGGEISSVKFYSTSYNTPYTSASTADVYVKEVNYIVIDNANIEPKANCTIVYQGNVTVERVGPNNQEWGEMTITFTTPYQYRGGNLLIGIDNTTNAGWKRFLFQGQSVMWHAGAGGYQMTETYFPIWNWDFIPKTTFTYTPGTLPTYTEPQNLQVSNIETNAATLSWEAGADETSWNVEYKKSADEAWTAAGTASELTYLLENLEANTSYDARVQSVYADGGVSEWVTATFTTLEEELPAYEEFYLVGTFNDWSQAEDGGRLVFAATETEGVYETEGTLEAGAEFKVITPFADGWIWLGGVDENNVGYFLINDGLLNIPLQMVDGSNFRMEQGGKFTFSVNATNMTLTVIPIDEPGIIGDVNCDGEVTTIDITCLYNYLLNGDETYIATSDVDGDGEITTVDITVIYNILLGNK